MVEWKKHCDQLPNLEEKEGMEMKTLNDLCTLITKQTGFDYSNTIKPSLTIKREADTIPFIQNKDFEGTEVNLNTDFYIPISVAQKFPKILLDDKILLVSISGRIGNVGLYEIKDVSFVGGAICVCRLNKDTNGRYVLYFLQSQKGQGSLFHSVKAASHANITVEAIRKTIIPLPPLSEQQRIVGILDTFTSSIDNLKQQIAQRRKQYEYYRDQLIDLEGKEGVEMKYISQVAKSYTGLTYKPDNVSDTGILVLRSSNIGDDTLVFQDNVYVHMNVPERALVRENDLLICVRNGSKRLVGKAAMITKEAEGMAFGAFMTILRSIDINSKYLFYVWHSTKVKKQYKGDEAMPIAQITAKDFQKIVIPVPSLSEQQRIVDILDQFEASIQNLETQLKLRKKQYEYYRDKLLTFE